MKNYEILYLKDGDKFIRILLEFGERTKPVICKNTYAYQIFKSDKKIDDISERDPELLESELNIFGKAYEVKDFSKKYPDKEFAAIAMWAPEMYQIVLTMFYRTVGDAAIAVPKKRPIKCTTPKEIEWLVSTWSYDLILESFKFRIF